MKLDKKLSRRSKGLKKKSSKRTRKNVNQRGGYKYDSISFIVNGMKFERKSSIFAGHNKVNIATPLNAEDIKTLLLMYKTNTPLNTNTPRNNLEFINNLIKFVIKLCGYYSYLIHKQEGDHTRDRITNTIDNIYILLYILSVIYNKDSKLFNIFLKLNTKCNDQSQESMNSILCILKVMVTDTHTLDALFDKKYDILSERKHDNQNETYTNILSRIQKLIEEKITESVTEVEKIKIDTSVKQTYNQGKLRVNSGNYNILRNLKEKDEIRIIALFKLFLDLVFKKEEDKKDYIYQTLMSPDSLVDMNSTTDILQLLLTIA